MSYLLICMLPLFCAKLANTIFVDLTSYKNLMISKNKIPVSYTHLDVYKRQGQHHAGERHGAVLH